jgi:hypothetical protein
MEELAEPIIRAVGPIVVDPSALGGAIDFLTQSKVYLDVVESMGEVYGPIYPAWLL